MTKHRPARSLIALLGAVAVALGGCASRSGSLLPAGGVAPSSTAGSTGTPAGLAATVRKALSGVESVHVALAVDLDGRATAVTGDETLRGGKVQDLQLSSAGSHGSGPVRLVIADGKIYAKLPASVNTSGKPYVLISKDSRSSRARAAAARIARARETVSLADAADLLARASSARRVGSASIDGTPATRYAIRIDPATLPGRHGPATPFPALAFVRSLDVQLYLDPAGRPVRVDVSAAVAGHHGTARLSLSRYDQPVTINAPPPDQVGTV